MNKLLTLLGIGTGTRKGVTPAEEALAALKARGPELEQARADACKAFDAANADVGDRQSALTAAEDAYSADPSDRGAKSVRAAREALELAELRVRIPQRAAEAAVRALDAWRAEVAAAETALKQAQREARLAECRTRATLADFNARAAGPRARLMAALAEADAAAGEITSLRDEANEAAAALTAAGEPTSALGEFHLVASLIMAHAEARPAAAGGLLAYLGELGWFCQQGQLRSAVRPAISELLEKRRGETPAAYQGVTLKQLRAAFGARTLADVSHATAPFRDELNEISNAISGAESAAADDGWRREQAELEALNAAEQQESNERRGIAAQEPGMDHSRSTLDRDLDYRREHNGEVDAMSRSRASLRTMHAGNRLDS
jgi:hypothetical protein